MNLRTLDETVALYEGEATALQGALQYYLHDVTVRSTLRRVPLAEAMSIKPVARVFARLLKMNQGRWVKPARGRQPPTPRVRPLRLEYDELLQLHALHVAGELQPIIASHQDPLQVCLGKLDQRAQNLSLLFQL
jgi:hypothetical protein